MVEKIVIGLVVALCPALSQASDTVEPWERGLSNWEAFVAAERPSGELFFGGVIGAGMTSNFSLGLNASGNCADSKCEYGLGPTLIYTPYDGVVSFDLLADMTAGLSEFGALPWDVGFELSFPNAILIPYGRAFYLGRSDDPYVDITALLGAKLPLFSNRLQLHFEAETVVEEQTLTAAFGPNVMATKIVELQPDFRYTFEHGGGRSWIASLGVIITAKAIDW